MTRAWMRLEFAAYVALTAVIFALTPLWIIAALLYRKPLLGVLLAVVVVAATF